MLPWTSWLVSLGGNKLLSFVPQVAIGKREGPVSDWPIPEGPAKLSLQRIAGSCIEDSFGGIFSFSVMVLASEIVRMCREYIELEYKIYLFPVIMTWLRCLRNPSTRLLTPFECFCTSNKWLRFESRVRLTTFLPFLEKSRYQHGIIIGLPDHLRACTQHFRFGLCALCKRSRRLGSGVRVFFVSNFCPLG
jgi:hypothetical protein